MNQFLGALSFGTFHNVHIFLSAFMLCITIFSLVAASVMLFSRKKKVVLILVLAVGVLLCTFLFSRIHWLVKEAETTHKVEPELCDALETPFDIRSVNIYYKFTMWPFSDQSFYQIDNLPQDSPMHRKLHEVMIDTDDYTYIVSYGLKVVSIEYRFEHWYESVASPEFEYGDEVPGYVFIYRIPALEIDNIS